MKKGQSIPLNLHFFDESGIEARLAAVENMTAPEIEARLAAIHSEVETRGAAIAPKEIEEYEKEVAALTKRQKDLKDTAERRSALLTGIASGITPSTVLRTFPAAPGNTPPAEVDPFDTTEYRRAFMEYVCRGRAIPVELRANEMTATADVGAVIPTTILKEIISKAESYGNIYNRVRKLNIQGGVAVPILDVKPVASWIDEATPSDEQKLTANSSVIFNYYGLECRMAQSLLVSIVTFDEFQRQFIPLATEAVIKAIEIAIFNGTGTASMTGILNDTRVPAANKITLTATDIAKWVSWKKMVFGKMKKAYRNGVFTMAQGTFDGYIDGMVDSTGQPIGRINYGIEGEEKYRFGGKIVETVEDEVLPAYDDAAAGDVFGAFVKFSDYAINTNMQMRVTKWTDENTNKVKNKCIMVIDGKLLDPNGVILLIKG